MNPGGGFLSPLQALLAAPLTSGSIPFADANGLLAQDNTNLRFIDADNQLVLGAGTGALPSLTTNGDLDTGIFWNATNSLALTAGANTGLRVVFISGAVGSVTRAGGGALSTPGLSFVPDDDSGFYSIADGRIGCVTNAVARLEIDTNTAASETPLLVTVAAGALVRVSVGAADSGGTGFRYLRVPN